MCFFSALAKPVEVCYTMGVLAAERPTPYGGSPSRGLSLRFAPVFRKEGGPMTFTITLSLTEICQVALVVVAVIRLIRDIRRSNRDSDD